MDGHSNGPQWDMLGALTVICVLIGWIAYLILR